MTYYTPSSERPADIERIRAQARGVPYHPRKEKAGKKRPLPSQEDCHRLFTIESGNRWLDLARREPEARQLFGELWHENELCMMFADTNIGKSVLAVQIGESIARGQGTGPFPCQAEPQRVAYFDFELTRRQFGMRYTKDKEDYQFSDNFFRAEYNFVDDLSPDVDENELLIAAIEYKINRVNAKVVILDNITCLRGGTENSAVALSLMKSLKAFKTTNKLSILVLAHTPKRRNSTRPISADDLHGSKLLVNFSDSAFALGKSSAETGLCYLKQVKQRNTRQRYGEDNVCLCRLQKPGTFLQFKFDGCDHERRHLLTRTAAERLQLTDQIVSLYAAGFSQRDIAGKLGIGLATVNKWLHYDEDCDPDKPKNAVAQQCNPDKHSNENESTDMCNSGNGEKQNADDKYNDGRLNDDCAVDKEEIKGSTATENYKSADANCPRPDEINEEKAGEFEENMNEENEDATEYVYNGTNGPMTGLWPKGDYKIGAALSPAVRQTYKTTEIDEKLTPERLRDMKDIAELKKSIQIVKLDGSSEPFIKGGRPGDCP